MLEPAILRVNLPETRSLSTRVPCSLHRLQLRRFARKLKEMSRVHLVGLLALALVGCGGSVVPPGGGDSRRDGNTIVWPEGGVKDRSARDTSPFLQDLPTNAGDPCTYGKCGPNLICMANICMTMCIQPMSGCNDKVATCKAASEACMYASDFTDACYPATAKEGQPCDMMKGLYCLGGALCVKVGNATPKCLRLCKYNCPTGSQCGKTNNNCSVCIPL
jgi:hypothetical protein